MKKHKQGSWRVTARLRGDLEAKVKGAAKAKRWSINTFIEEAVMTAIPYHEGQ